MRSDHTASYITPRDIIEIDWGLRAEPTWILYQLLKNLKKKLAKDKKRLQQAKFFSASQSDIITSHIEEVNFYLSSFHECTNAVISIISFLNKKLAEEGTIDFTTPAAQLIKTVLAICPSLHFYMSDTLNELTHPREFWDEDVLSCLRQILNEITENSDRRDESLLLLIKVKPFLITPWRNLAVDAFIVYLMRPDALYTSALFEALNEYKHEISERESTFFIPHVIRALHPFDEVSLSALKLIEGWVEYLSRSQKLYLGVILRQWMNTEMLDFSELQLVCNVLLAIRNDISKITRSTYVKDLHFKIDVCSSEKESALFRETATQCMAIDVRTQHADFYLRKLIEDLDDINFIFYLNECLTYVSGLEMNVAFNKISYDVFQRLLGIYNDDRLLLAVRGDAMCTAFNAIHLAPNEMRGELIRDGILFLSLLSEPFLCIAFRALLKAKPYIQSESAARFIDELYDYLTKPYLIYTKVSALHVIAEMQANLLPFRLGHFLTLKSIIVDPQIFSELRIKCIHVIGQSLLNPTNKFKSDIVDMLVSIICNDKEGKGVRLEASRSILNAGDELTDPIKQKMLNYLLMCFSDASTIKTFLANILLYELKDVIPVTMHLEICDVILNYLSRHSHDKHLHILPTLRRYSANLTMDQKFILLCKIKKIVNTDHPESVLTYFATYHAYRNELVKRMLSSTFKHGPAELQEKIRVGAGLS